MKRRRPHVPIRLTAKITAVAVAAALALTGGLAVRMAQGEDPSLPAKAASTSHSTARKATSVRQPTSNQPASAPATVTTRTS